MPHYTRTAFVGLALVGPALAGIALAGITSLPALAADPAAGEKVFKAQCSACHTTEAGKNRIGPSLFGIVGRHSGMAEGFRYSTANKAADLTWDAATLDRYLASPRAVVPGTTMSYAGLRNDGQRADLIAWLETVK
jgi:cytochrome c